MTPAEKELAHLIEDLDRLMADALKRFNERWKEYEDSYDPQRDH